MDPERRREIASMGGRASHAGRGSDYENDDSDDSEDEGQSSQRNTRGGSREQHAEAGRRGAEARWGSDDER